MSSLPLQHHHHQFPHNSTIGSNTVDVAMETLASVWACDLGDLSDPGDGKSSCQQHEPAAAWEAQCVLNYSSPPGPVWTDQLSPHLQRNKQLQDTLLQREEELARLQEENNKLREFLNSSFVKNLEEKAKKLDVDGRKKLKRSLQHADNGTFQNLCSSQLLLDTQRISKRVCRNLTAKFCSQPEISAASEPNLDLWVLRTLGLKDRDTIDTSDDSSSSFTKCTNSSSSSSEYSLGTSYDTAVISPDRCPADCSSSDYTVHSSFSPPISTSTPPATHNCDTYCPTSRHQTTCRSNGANECQETNINLPSDCSNPAFGYSIQNCKSSLDQCLNFTAARLMGPYETNDAVISRYQPITTFQSPQIQRASKTDSMEIMSFTDLPERAQLSSFTASNQARSQDKNLVEHLSYWSPQQQTQSQETIKLMKSPERLQFSPFLASTPVTSHYLSSMEHRTPSKHCQSPTSTLGGATAATQPPATPQMPRCETDVAFSMSLSPSSSVKTHSFPQGQAFVRKDMQGRWNFTWVPKQGP